MARSRTLVCAALLVAAIFFLQCGLATATASASASASPSTLFAVLGLDAGAAPAEIKRAYRSLALRHHPDIAQARGAGLPWWRELEKICAHTIILAHFHDELWQISFKKTRLFVSVGSIAFSFECTLARHQTHLDVSIFF